MEYNPVAAQTKVLFTLSSISTKTDAIYEPHNFDDVYARPVYIYTKEDYNNSSYDLKYIHVVKQILRIYDRDSQSHELCSYNNVSTDRYN